MDLAPRVSLRPSRRLALTALLALLFVCGLAPVAPHARPVRAANFVSAAPNDQAALTSEPATVSLTFDDRIVGGPDSTIDVTFNGQKATVGLANVDAATGTILSVKLRPGLGNGTYQVRWKAVDFGDGTPQGGSFSFTVVGPPACAAPRFAVKTLTDADVRLVNLTQVVRTTAGALADANTLSATIQITPPLYSVGTSAPNIVPVALSNTHRLNSEEFSAYQITVNQVEAERTDYGAIRLIVQDPNTADTLAVEFPDTAECPIATDPALNKRMQAARDAFIAAEGMPPLDNWMQLGDQAQITGVGLFNTGVQDATGAAANGFELSPVLSYVQVGSPNTSPTPAPAVPVAEGIDLSTAPPGIDGAGIVLSPNMPPPLTDGVTAAQIANQPPPEGIDLSGPQPPTADGFPLHRGPISPGAGEPAVPGDPFASDTGP